MTRRFLAPIGLLLLTLPQFAAASVDCAALTDIAPISTHYVQPLLDRADRGIAYAKEARTNDDFVDIFPWWAQNIGGSFAQLIDSRQSLTNTSACLRFDELLIECKINDVKIALDEELARGSFVSIMRLESLLLYLKDALYHLEAGSADGSYEDTSWETQMPFDREAPTPLGENRCPFHSDYTPPRMTGYGCDVSVMTTILGNSQGGDHLSFVRTERDSLQTLEQAIDDFREIAPLLGESSESSTEASNTLEGRKHNTAIGCQVMLGTCSNDTDLECSSDEFCASRNAGTCTPPTEMPAPIPTRSLRGSFSFGRDHLTILTTFVEKRVQDGLSRTFPESWAHEDDLSDEALESREYDNRWLDMARDSFRVVFRSISGMMGRTEGASFPEASDSQLEIAEALGGTRESMAELSKLASEKDGVRAFVANMAFFLRRTCIHRPCQKTLEQVIRIALQDDCFPYTNGEFLSDTAEDPRWQKCAIAACVQVDDADGNPINLPDSCDDVLLP